MFIEWLHVLLSYRGPQFVPWSLCILCCSEQMAKLIICMPRPSHTESLFYDREKLMMYSLPGRNQMSNRQITPPLAIACPLISRTLRAVWSSTSSLQHKIKLCQSLRAYQQFQLRYGQSSDRMYAAFSIYAWNFSLTCPMHLQSSTKRRWCK